MRPQDKRASKNCISTRNELAWMRAQAQHAWHSKVLGSWHQPQQTSSLQATPCFQGNRTPSCTMSPRELNPKPHHVSRGIEPQLVWPKNLARKSAKCTRNNAVVRSGGICIQVDSRAPVKPPRPPRGGKRFNEWLNWDIQPASRSCG